MPEAKYPKPIGVAYPWAGRGEKGTRSAVEVKLLIPNEANRL